MVNPLIAEAKDDTEAYSGVPLLESAFDLKKAIESGDWASVALGAVGTALDALGMALDPFGAILAAGVGWLMEHVGPLKEALDGLAGDPEEIKAHSETWKNVATELGSIGEDFTSMATNDTVSWQGEAADTYRQRSADTVALLSAAQQGADGASNGIKTAGEVVAAVRSLVRDIIAELVGHLISWALQVVFTLGIGMAWVVPQVIAEVAKVASKIADLVKRLVQALKALGPLLKKAGDIFGDAAKALKNIKSGKGTPPPKVDAPTATPKGIDTPKGDGTTPSNANPTPSPEVKPPPKTDGPTTPSSSNDTPTPSPNPGSSSSKNGDSGPTNPSNSGGSPNKPNPPRDNAVGKNDRVCKSDPVDIATGDVLLAQIDLELPALILERTHISSYRAGRWFGVSWASTVDQRLEVDDENVCYFSPDGLILVYPIPAAGTPVLPVEGPRWPLVLEQDGTHTLKQAGYTLRFGMRQGNDRGVLPLIAMDTPDGARIDIEHTPSGAPRLLTHSNGYRVAFRHDHGRVTQLRVLDTDGRPDVVVLEYRYDARGRLAQVVNSSRKPLVFDYDAAGRITGWQDRNGTWYRYVYDADGRCVRTVGDGGFQDGIFAYDRERLVTTYTDSLGNVSEFHLNEANQLIREIDPLGNTTVSSWDRYDRLLSRTDPLGRTTHYEYTVDGELETVIRPDGSRVRINRRDFGRLSITVDDGTRSWHRVYHGDSAPDPFTTQIGVATPVQFESQRNEDLFTGQAPEPVGVTAHRDLFGRPRAVTDATGGQTQLGWTIEGRRASRIGPLGRREEWRYDAEGNTIEYAGGPDQPVRREYGAFDLLTASIDPTGARTTYDYDTELRLTRVTNPLGLSWRYSYDPAGRLVEETDFDGRMLRFDYDAAGQLIRSVNGMGEVTGYVYDAVGNVVERRTLSGVTTYSYDPVGRLIRATNPDSVLEFERDDQGRVIRESVNGRAVTFTYEARGMRRLTPSGADSVWTFDDAGNPETLAASGHLVVFRHDQAGREIERRIGNGAALTQSFDSEYQLTGQTITASSGSQRRVVQQRHYQYRVDGHLVGVDDAISGPVRFQLDPAGRVTEVWAPDGAESYRYDPSGNIVHSLRPPGDSSRPDAELGPRSYAGTALTAAGSVGYRYDRQGRMTARRLADPVLGERVWTYTWDSHDRLTGVSTPDGARWRYLYDPLGRRIAKQRLAPGGRQAEPVVAEQVEFVWSGQVLIEQVHRDQRGHHLVITWDHHPGSARLVTQTEHLDTTGGQNGSGARFFSIVTDPIGTPKEMVDVNGVVAWHGKATLWGKAMWGRAGGVATPLRFPGQYADTETGLHYNVYRYYDPGTGRYVSQDPLGLRPAPNPVAYVPNPLRDSDPLGLTPCAGSGDSSGVPDRPGAGSDAGHLQGPGPQTTRGGTKTDDHPDLGPNAGFISGPTTKWDNGIQSTPVSQFTGYHGVKPDYYQDVLNGVGKPPTGTAGNHDPDWKGWYLGEDKEHAGGYAFDDNGNPGAVLKYDLPNGATVHTVPPDMINKVDELKQHFGIDPKTPLMDGLAAQNGIIRTQDSDGLHELIVPWDTAANGKASHHAYVDGMGTVGEPGDKPPRRHPLGK